MSRINGEKARAAVQRRGRTKQRVKDRAAKAGAGDKKPGGRPMAARAARRGR
ncbi:MAG: hypothetical protein AABO58_02265 [Acidobacteriota bacterium]